MKDLNEITNQVDHLASKMHKQKLELVQATGTLIALKIFGLIVVLIWLSVSGLPWINQFLITIFRASIR